MKMDPDELNALEERICKAAQSLIQAKGLDRVPTDLEQLCQTLEVKLITKVLRSPALLVSSREGKLIVVNASDSSQRRRFSIAHEIGHLLLDGMLDKTSRPTIAVQGRSRYRADEHLCNIAATELLMPEYLFRQATGGQPMSADIILKISEQFDVSVEAVVRRLSYLSLWKCVFIAWRVLDGYPTGQELGVWWTSQPKEYQVFIPKRDRAGAESLIREAYLRRLERGADGGPFITSGVEKVNIGGLRGNYYVEALALPALRDCIVLSLFSLATPYPPPPQRAVQLRFLV